MQGITSLTVTEPTFSFDVSFNDFNLNHTLGSAQSFTWTKVDSAEFPTWHGSIGGQFVIALQQPATLNVYTDASKADVVNYFSLDADRFKFSDVIKSLVIESEHDEVLLAALEAFPGLRILRQDPRETIASFICSQNSNVAMIRERVKLLCEKFSSINAATHGDYPRLVFPSPQQIAFASLEDLLACKMGYRAAYLKQSAELIASGQFDLSKLKKMNYSDSRNYLLSLPGVGPKVADCICLFSLGHTNAFPIDTHVFQILNDFYGSELRNLQGDKRNLSYNDLAFFSNKKFGQYCGYAQQYLFHLHRVAKYKL